jgi:hypothetical protein
MLEVSNWPFATYASEQNLRMIAEVAQADSRNGTLLNILPHYIASILAARITLGPTSRFRWRSASQSQPASLEAPYLTVDLGHWMKRYMA